MNNVLKFKFKINGETEQELVNNAVDHAKPTVNAFADLLTDLDINIGEEYCTVTLKLSREVTQEEYAQRANVQ